MKTSSVSTLNQVKGWILEYAIKHGMNNIVKHFEGEDKRTSAQQQKGTSPSQQSNPAEGLPDVVIVLWFLHSVFRRLEDCRQYENVEKLQHLLVALQKVFSWCETLSLDTFWALHTKIKVMVLVQSLRQKTATAQLFNDYFPLWSRTYEDKLRLEYKIKNKTVLELIRKDNENCRLFLFYLMINENHLVTYYKKFLICEWEDYVDDLKRLLTCFLEAIMPMLPATKVENILEGNISKELSDSTNPAVHILLNGLKSCTAERDSVENALQKALLDLANHSKSSSQEASSQRRSQRSSPNSADLASQKSPANSTELVPERVCRFADAANNVPVANFESPISPNSPEVEVVETNSSPEDEPVPSTSSGITHNNRKKRRIHLTPRRRSLVKRPLIFKSNSKYLFLSSDSDSS